MIKFFPFGNWNPDGPRIGAGMLDRATNLLPIFGGLRMIRGRSDKSTQADDDPVTGAFAHIFNNSEAVQFGRPDTHTSSTFTRSDSVGTGSAINDNIYELVDEQFYNDGDYAAQGGAEAGATIEFGLTDLDTPSSTANHKIRYRYKILNHVNSSGWSVNWELLEGGASYATPITGTAETGTADTSGWTAVENTITDSASQSQQISDFADLSLKFTTTTEGPLQEGLPVSDFDNGDMWTKKDGTTTTDIYESIDESTADDDTSYIISVPIEDGASTSYICKLSTLVNPFQYAQNHSFSVRYKKPQVNTQLRVEIGEGSNMEEILATIAGPSTAVTSWTTITHTFTGEHRGIEDWDDLYVRFTVLADGAATELTQLRPDEDVTFTSLNTTDGGGVAYTEVDEAVADDADYIYSNSGGTGIAVLGLGSGDDPGPDDTNHSLTFRAKHGGTSLGSMTIAIKQGGVTKLTKVYAGSALTSAWAEYTWSLSEAEAALLTDYSTLSVSITMASPVGQIFYLSQIYLQYGIPRTALITWCEYDPPSTSQVQISWVEMEVPSSSTYYLSDETNIFAGTNTELYHVSQDAWTECTDTVTASGEYGGNTPVPLSWSFAQWGAGIIATNYSDPVQWKDDASEITGGSFTFVDMITSTSKPKARFVAAVRNHVVLANINLANHYADELWWSAVDDNLDFDISATKQCDIQRLLQTPGEITGLVGGEYGIVFKRSSVYRMSYVGSPLIFEFDLLSSSVGTAYPRSIVVVGRDVFFYSGSGFSVLRGGAQLEEGIDEGISRFISDNTFSVGPLIARDSQDVRVIDADMFGAYDPFSKCIFWFYQKSGDTQYESRRAILYDTRTGRWGLINSGGLDICNAVSLPNTANAKTHITKGLGLFCYDASDTTEHTYAEFNDSSTISSVLRTKVFSIEDGVNTTIQRFRPIYELQPAGGVEPNLTVQIDSSNDPMMEIDVVQTTGTMSQQDSDGWLPLLSSGEFHRITVNVPSLLSQNIVDFQGFHLDYVIEGER